MKLILFAASITTVSFERSPDGLPASFLLDIDVPSLKIIVSTATWPLTVRAESLLKSAVFIATEDP